VARVGSDGRTSLAERRHRLNRRHYLALSVNIPAGGISFACGTTPTPQL